MWENDWDPHLGTGGRKNLCRVNFKPGGSLLLCVGKSSVGDQCISVPNRDETWLRHEMIGWKLPRLCSNKRIYAFIILATRKTIGTPFPAPFEGANSDAWSWQAVWENESRAFTLPWTPTPIWEELGGGSWAWVSSPSGCRSLTKSTLNKPSQVKIAFWLYGLKFYTKAVGPGNGRWRTVLSIAVYHSLWGPP